MNVGDRVMRKNLDYGVMVGTIVEVGQDNSGRERDRVKWDRGVRTWNLATVLFPLDHDGFVHLVEDYLVSLRRYCVKNHMSPEWTKQQVEQSRERHAKLFTDTFGRKWGDRGEGQ